MPMPYDALIVPFNLGPASCRDYDTIVLTVSTSRLLNFEKQNDEHFEYDQACCCPPGRCRLCGYTLEQPR
jgi:hypothetical protein